MSIKEKVAYLKGLAEGIGLDSETKEGKLISAIIETLADMASEIEELGENALDIGEELDAISDDLADVEEFLFDDDYDDDEDYDDFCDSGDDDCDCEGCRPDDCFSYEVECPNCGAEIELDESDLALGSINCSACGEELEFEFDDVDDDIGEDEQETEKE